MRKEKKGVLTLSIEPSDAEGLARVAGELGYTWGERPSPSALAAAIGRGEVVVARSEDLEELRILREKLQAVRSIVAE